MATVTYFAESAAPFCHYMYKITSLISGANSITLPAPPLSGSFPPAADWTPTNILVYPYAIGAVSAMVSPDLTTITNTSGTIAFTLYSSGNANAVIEVW